MEEDQVQRPGSIETVSMKIPNFWPSDPQLWFLQVEAQFGVRQTTREATKYGHVVAQLPLEIATEVRDIITDPGDTPYTTLKEAIIHRTAESRKQRLKQLLNAEELGDRKPSQLLRRMEQLLDGAAMDQQPLFQEIFLSRMPPHVRAVLASLSDDMTFQAQAAIADKIMEATGHVASAAAVQRGPSRMEEQLAALQVQVSNLSLQMARAAEQPRHRSRDQPRSRSRSRSRPANRRPGEEHAPTDDGLCWYHHRFGSEARACRAPCTFQISQRGNEGGGA